MLVGKALAKQASDESQGGGSSPGVSRSISPTGKIETGHSDAKPGTGQSSTNQKAPGASSATNLETCHSIGNGKTASQGPGALPESNASQPTGQPAGGKPADAAMVSTADKVRALTQKQINAPRERDTAGLISQGMNTGDTTAQNAFTHHGGAKTAADAPGKLHALKDGAKAIGSKVKDIFKGEGIHAKKTIEELRGSAEGLPERLTKGVEGETKKMNLQNRAAQGGAVAGTGLALAGAGAAGHHALKDKGEHKEASAPTEQDLSIKTASAEELLRKLKEQVSA